MKKKFFLQFALLLIISLFATAQKISTLDIVKGKQEYEKEVMYFYEQNWKAFRQEALKLKYISAYRLMKTKTDSTGFFTLILLTEYKDSVYYKEAERNFGVIMKKISPNGPKMLNSIKRNEFLTYVTGFEAKNIYTNQ